MANEKRRSCGGIWNRTSKAGNNYKYIKIDPDCTHREFVAFPNQYKEEDKHPDYKVYPSENRPSRREDDEW